MYSFRSSVSVCVNNSAFLALKSMTDKTTSVAYPDPAFHFKADQDPAFHFKVDQDPTFHESETPPLLQSEPLRPYL